MIRPDSAAAPIPSTATGGRDLDHPPRGSLPPFLFPLVLPALLLALPAGADPQGTAFTYQGQLRDAGDPATGLYALQACLFDAMEAGLELGCVDRNDVPVEDGLFAVALDFGEVFSGERRWLELRLRPGDSSGAHTVLAPRQALRPVPAALHAVAADQALQAVSAGTAATAGSTPWAGLTGVPAGFADGEDADSGGTVTRVSAGTGLSGGEITGSGTLGIADGGVGPAQLAAGAVGAAQIDPGQVQVRVSGACPFSYYLRGINADGSVLCDLLPPVSVPPQTVDEVGFVGLFSDIAIGADGRPVISYFSSTDSALKVAHCGDTACSVQNVITTVDNADNLGRYTSIAIGADGMPVISYHAHAGDLKVARCGTPNAARVTLQRWWTPATMSACSRPSPSGWTGCRSSAIATMAMPTSRWRTAATLRAARAIPSAPWTRVAM